MADKKAHHRENAYFFSGVSVNASRAWKILRLLMYWMSPFWKFNPRLYFSAKKWIVSKASAWASVIGGMSVDRGNPKNPVNSRRAYWMMTLPSSEKSRGRSL